MRPRAFGLLVLFASAGCLDPRVYPCRNDVQCTLHGTVGQCRVPGYCAYDDQECPGTALRYGPTAAELSGTCVPPGAGGVSGTGTGGGTNGSGTATGTGGGTAGCGGGCHSPPGPCHEAVGTCEAGTCVYALRSLGEECQPNDPCFEPGACDGKGTCIGSPVLCEQSTDPCKLPNGTCDPTTGMCGYGPTDAATPCEDGNGCTMGDACDGNGQCVPGPECPSDDPCQDGVCNTGQCQFVPHDDGTSCGSHASDRCCGGTCVDISTDAANCGGCSMACASGESCESVGATTACPVAPASTTGRCTCPATNSSCPHGQICRTVTPVNNRCAPQGPEDCVDMFVDVQNCPNYCSY